MSKMIQIRVPERLHRRLKARAATMATSLSNYLLRELRRLADKPTREELLARLPRYDDRLTPSPAEVVRAERGSRPESS